MVSQDDDGQQSLVLGFVFGLVALVIVLVMGVAISTSISSRTGKTDSKPVVAVGPAADFQPIPATAPRAADAKAAEAEAAQAAADAASIRVESGVVKFYFASAKAELAPASAAVLADLIAGARTGRKLLISGYHDATGDPVRNAELARQRALSVSTLLKSSGVGAQQIELGKPQQAQQRDSDAEARRVEVSLQ